MALAMIEEAEKRGDLRPGMRVIEYTGGSTGSSVAMVCAVKGYLFEALSSNAFAEAEPETFYTDQLNNRDSVLGYRKIDGKISAFCGAVGTAGMLMGVSRALREAGGRARIDALEPAESPVITKGTGGPHRVEGIGVGFWPPHLRREDFDEAREIPEAAARAMARRLATEKGIFAGTSTGLDVSAAVDLARELGPGATVVTVACDSGLKYLSGDLYTG